MRQPFLHEAGGVLSADIAVPDHAEELDFYSKVLSTGEAPLWRTDLTNNEGTPIIGLGARTEQYDALPLQWMPHIQVADVATSVARALELGARQLLHAKSDEGQSQWAVLEDPDGAAFGLIPVVPAVPTTTDKEQAVGHIARLTLAVPDSARARDFYQHVVGWSARGGADTFEMGPRKNVSVATICPPRAGLPAVWILSLPVGDLDESLRRVRSGGGKVIHHETLAPGHVVIQDPVGVCVALQSGRALVAAIPKR